MKTVKIQKEIEDWIKQPGNHLYRDGDGYVLNSGYFSGGGIPERLREFLIKSYELQGSILIRFIPNYL
jgi:hypothetical protein